jgi:hypothetical protein
MLKISQWRMWMKGECESICKGAFHLAKNRVNFFNSDKFDVLKMKLAPELLKNLNFPGYTFSCEQKIPSNIFS